MWTSDLSDCWLNTPDVKTADDDDVGGPCAASVADHQVDLLEDFDVAAEPSGLSFHQPDTTFQPDPFSPIPLPVLHFCDTKAPLEEQLVTPPVLTKTTQRDFNTSAGCTSATDLGPERPDDESVLSTTFNSPLLETRQEQFIVIQLPMNSSDLISLLSRVTNNNNEFVVDSNSSPEIQHQPQQQQQQELTSKNYTSTSTAEDRCSGYRLEASVAETGSDVRRLSEDVMWMLEDAASIVVGELVMSSEYRSSIAVMSKPLHPTEGRTRKRGITPKNLSHCRFW